MRPIALALVPLFILTGLACATRSSQPAPQPYAYGPPPGAQCMDGPPVCGADRRAVVQCQRGAWIVLQSCPGPQGCGIAGNAIQCDAVAGRPPPTPAPAGGGAGQPCAAEGGYDCTADRRSLTMCRGGRTAIVSTCRGARGCVVGNAVDCDHSIAAVGDPCDGPKEIACSLDSKQLLRCAGTAYQVGESCRNACLATGGRVLCQ